MRYIFTICVLFFTSQALFAQCFMDRHNTTWHDAWISCTPSINPNPRRDDGHWLRYDLGHFYKLESSQFWNANQPEHLDYGLQNIVIDYSLDGLSWEEWGTYTLPQGTGENFYEGTEGPNFDGLIARYILITALYNYGGTCFSLSEMKINVQEFSVNVEEITNESFSIYPNPTNAILNIELFEYENDANAIEILDVFGRVVMTVNIAGKSESIYQMNLQDLVSGTYFVKIKGDKANGVVRFVKQ